MSFDEGRQKLWKARDDLDDAITMCYYLHRSFSDVGLMKPAIELRELSASLSRIKGRTKEAEAEMSRAHYDKENNEQD